MSESKYMLSQNFIISLVTRVLIFINIAWIIIAIIDTPSAIIMTGEDRIIQWLQFIFLLLTALYCFNIGKGYGKFHQQKLISIGFYIFLIMTLFLAFEEISWGQRIFGFKTPEYIREINAQNELTLHNHSSFQRYRHWLTILFGFTGILLIHANRYENFFNRQLLFFSPPAFFKLAFIIVATNGVIMEIGYLAKAYYFGNEVSLFYYLCERFTEIGELCLTITAFTYSADRFNNLIEY